MMMQNLPDAAAIEFRQMPPMPYDPEQVRTAMRSVMEQKQLNPESWSGRIGAAPNTIRRFLDGSTNSPNLETFVKLADAAEVDLYELLGQTPPWREEALAAKAELRRISREREQGLRRLRRLERALLALAAMPDDEPPADDPSSSDAD